MFKSTVINLFKHHCVRMNCLFFKETHKSVTSVRGYHVTKEIGIEKDTLGNCDHNSEQNAWASLFQKEKNDKFRTVIDKLSSSLCPIKDAKHGLVAMKTTDSQKTSSGEFF